LICGRYEENEENEVSGFTTLALALRVLRAKMRKIPAK
jgi:hypothetical protein